MTTANKENSPIEGPLQQTFNKKHVFKICVTCTNMKSRENQKI